MVALAKYCGATISDLDQMAVSDLADWLHWANQHAALDRKANERAQS